MVWFAGCANYRPLSLRRRRISHSILSHSTPTPVSWGQRTARIEVMIAQVPPDHVPDRTATARLSCGSSDPAEAASTWISIVGVTPTPSRRPPSPRMPAPAPCPHCNRAEGQDLPRPPFTPDDESQTALSKGWSRTFESRSRCPPDRPLRASRTLPARHGAAQGRACQSPIDLSRIGPLDYPLVTKGAGAATGYLPTGLLPTGYLPMGYLPTGAAATGAG